MGRNKESIAAAVAILIIVLLLVMAGIIIRPSEPEYAQPERQDTVIVVSKKQKTKKETKKESKPKRKPQQRDFLNEPVPSE